MFEFSALNDCSQLNVLGVPTIEYAPTTDVLNISTFELSSGLFRGTISLKDTKKWLKMPFRLLDPDKQFWEETKSVTAQGSVTDVKIQAILSMQSAQVQAQLDNMERQKFIVRIEDLSGRIFVFGSLKFPLSFSASWSSTRGFYTVMWQGKQPFKAVGY